MKLFLISQTENNKYDTYDGAVVCASDENEARLIHPKGSFSKTFDSMAWCSSPEHVKVDLIGDAVHGMTAGVLCSSFNAG